MIRRKAVAKVGLMGLCVALVLGGVQASAAESSDVEFDRFPGQGLPYPGVGGAYVSPQQSALTYLKKARQWVRTPVLQSVAFNRDTQTLKDRTCLRIPHFPGAQSYREWRADITMVNLAAAPNSPRRFGATQPFTVQSLAFGSIPVEATVALEQPRNSKGVVIPLGLKQEVAEYCASYGGFEIPVSGNGRRLLPAQGGGALRVRIDRLAVDGVALRMTGTCATDEAALNWTSRDYLSWDPRIPAQDRSSSSPESIMRTKYFDVTGGGLLFGSLDIPPFHGCITETGEDVSRLLTATVSGDANAVQIRSQSVGGEAQVPGDVLDACPYTGNCQDYLWQSELPVEPPA